MPDKVTAADIYMLGYEAGDLETMGLIRINADSTVDILPAGRDDPRVAAWERKMLRAGRHLNVPRSKSKE